MRNLRYGVRDVSRVDDRSKGKQERMPQMLHRVRSDL